MTVIVRPIADEDRIAVSQMIESIFPSSGGRFATSDRIWVAEEDGRVVGFVRFSLRGGRRVLNGLGTLPEKREQGIGTQLLEHALERMGKETRPIYLKVKALNPAVNLYERFGFVLKKFGRTYVLVREAGT